MHDLLQKNGLTLTRRGRIAFSALELLTVAALTVLVVVGLVFLAGA